MLSLIFFCTKSPSFCTSYQVDWKYHVANKHIASIFIVTLDCQNCWRMVLVLFIASTRNLAQRRGEKIDAGRDFSGTKDKRYHRFKASRRIAITQVSLTAKKRDSKCLIKETSHSLIVLLV